MEPGAEGARSDALPVVAEGCAGVAVSDDVLRAHRRERRRQAAAARRHEGDAGRAAALCARPCVSSPGCGARCRRSEVGRAASGR